MARSGRPSASLRVSAPITRAIRGIRSEVELGIEHGLAQPCVISCDNVVMIPLEDLDDQPVGHLDETTHARLDEALRYSLDTVYYPSHRTARFRAGDRAPTCRS